MSEPAEDGVSDEMVSALTDEILHHEVMSEPVENTIPLKSDVDQIPKGHELTNTTPNESSAAVIGVRGPMAVALHTVIGMSLVSVGVTSVFAF